MLLNLNKKDAKFIKTKYPALKILSKNPLEIVGTFEFHAIYQEYEIKDSYDIEIVSLPNRVFPRIRETSEKIKTTAMKNNKLLGDMHINIDDSFSACLCPPIQEKIYEKQDMGVTEFIEKYIVPFFYEQSYFRKNKKWPWGEYGHGIIGILESYLDYSSNKETACLFLQVLEEHCKKYNFNFNFYTQQLKQKIIKGRNSCPVCASNDRWEKCHTETLESMRKLKSDLDTFKIKV